MPHAQPIAISPAGRAAHAPLGWRGYGQGLRDLDVDFGSADRPGLITSLLAACAASPLGADGEASLWHLTLSARIAGLVAIETASSGRDHLPMSQPCPHEGCAEEIGFSLPADALAALAQEAEDGPELRFEGAAGAVILRRPRGADQRLWARQSYDNAEEAEAAILQSLILSGTLLPEDSAAAGEALAEADPLSAFQVSMACPACAREVDLPLDLEGELLRLIGARQTRLLLEIDRLARRYGWCEADILAIPPARRARYMALDGAGWR